MISQEAILHKQVVNYIKTRYPAILFRTDFAAGIKMTIGQARKHKGLQHGRAWPDLFIAKPRGIYHGLFIELKATNIYKKDGTLLKNEHLSEQADILSELNMLGYCATFAIGLDQAIRYIDDYLK